MSTTFSTCGSRARCGRRCDPMFPRPMTATTGILKFLRRPAESAGEISFLGAESARRTVTPARQFFGLVIADTALRAADANAALRDDLLAARAVGRASRS